MKYIPVLLLTLVSTVGWCEEDNVWYCSSDAASIVYAGQEPKVARPPLAKFKMKWDRDSEHITVADSDYVIEYACSYCVQFELGQALRTEFDASTKYHRLRFTDGEYLLTLTAQDFTEVQAGTCTKF